MHSSIDFASRIIIFISAFITFLKAHLWVYKGGSRFRPKIISFQRRKIHEKEIFKYLCKNTYSYGKTILLRGVAHLSPLLSEKKKKYFLYKTI